MESFISVESIQISTDYTAHYLGTNLGYYFAVASTVSTVNRDTVNDTIYRLLSNKNLPVSVCGYAISGTKQAAEDAAVADAIQF